MGTCRGTAPSGSAWRWPSMTAPSLACNSTPAPAGRSASGSTRSPEPSAGTRATPPEAALLRYLRPLLGDRARFPQHLHEEAREAGWTEEQLLEAIAVLTMESFTAMVNIAGDVPVDGSVEETRLRAA